MNRNLKITLNIVVWAALAVYLVLAAGYCSRRSADRVCTGLAITVRDSLKLGFVTEESVRRELVSRRMRLTGARLDSIGLRAVEQAVASMPYVERVQVYRAMDDKLHIEVDQRTPVVRVQTENGYRFYLSAAGHVMPLRPSATVDVPIVTGTPAFPFGTDFAGPVPKPDGGEKKTDENTRFLHNLINFVEFLREDPFWGGQVVQIHVTAGNEVELIPRVGRGTIALGGLEDHPEKLERLYKFYRRGLAYEGWNKYARIDLKYKGLVFCTE